MAKLSDQEVLARWTARDLTADAAAGRLPRAFEVDVYLDQIADLVQAGRRPVLTGPSGIGKSAVFYELARRAAAGEGAECFHGKRILELSILRFASTLKNPVELGPQIHALVEALLKTRGVVPFFRDLHLIDPYNLETQMQTLTLRFEGAILGEGDRARLDSAFEYFPELEQQFVLLDAEEPPLDTLKKIVAGWHDEQLATGRRGFAPEALEYALHLSHRFPGRNREPRRVIDMLSQVGSFAREPRPVTIADIVDRFCATHHVPRALVDPALPLDLPGLERIFRDEVLGQDEAVQTMVSVIGSIKAGLIDPRRPFGVFLFVGPTGVGKTHVAQLLAQYLFGSRDRMVRLNMADFPAETDALVLFGDPAHHMPAQVRGLLTRRVTGRPFGVLLLDEFEKAHAKVHDRFLQLFDEGRFINGAGEAVSCRSMIIIATSNAGAEVYRGKTWGFGGANRDLDAELDRILEQTFRFEFLNRFDRVVHFHPLSREDIRTIARRELAQLEKRAGLRQRRIGLEVDESVLDWLVVHGYDADYGARFLRRTIERHVTGSVADALCREPVADGGRVTLHVRGQAIAARPLRETPAAPRPERVTLPHGTADRERALDAGALREEAEQILAAAEPRLAGLEAKRAECSALLERMNAEGFWEDRAARAKVLDRFRELDVAVRAETRFAQPILALKQAGEGDPRTAENVRRLARAVEAAAASLAEWDDRLAEEGPGAAWLMISNVDPLRPAGDWVEELVGMELAWCRRLNLLARVVAYEQTDSELVRAAIEVEGPGAASYLEMERGVHRLGRHPEPPKRARIDLIPRGEGPAEGDRPASLPRAKQGLLGLRVACRTRVDVPSRGLAVELLGAEPDALAHLARDLRDAWRQRHEDSETARTYGETGSGARDPRTGAVAPRLKEALRGDLDVFLAAWRRR